MSRSLILSRAGEWFLSSGIQAESGAVARYYDAAAGKNRATSTEITGYAASAFVFLHCATGDPIYLDRAQRAADFLIEDAWDEGLGAFPYEHPSPSDVSDHHAYFFDTGIIIRGLIAVWRFTKESRLVDIAQASARAMIRNFHSGSDFHPVLALPGKRPMERDERWSRSAACYQLKAAASWLEVATITGDDRLREAYSEMLAQAMETEATFLPGTEDRHRIMDRLHAYCYFLEGLITYLASPCGTPDAIGRVKPVYGAGLARVSKYVREIAPCFARSDVYSQLLRARVYGASMNLAPMDATAASEEATAITQFQMQDADPRIDGGFAFGRRDGSLVPHVNPWATAFAIQALDLWHHHQAGRAKPCLELLI